MILENKKKKKFFEYLVKEQQAGAYPFVSLQFAGGQVGAHLENFEFEFE